MTNDVEELKRYTGVHARALGLDPAQCRRTLAGVHHDGDGPGSWVGEWSAAAERAGDPHTASRLYTMARFPFVDGPARERAAHHAVATFDAWRGRAGAIERVDVPVGGTVVPCWGANLSRDGTRRRPLMLFMGGIVSTKEQWAPALLAARRLGVAGLVAEMPGVGENPLPYTGASWRMLPDLLDAVRGRADVDRTYALAMSFSGNLALRAAAADPRIRGIVTAGAPVTRFFTDPGWQRTLPRVTTATLAHLTGAGPGGWAEHLAGQALDDGALAAVGATVCCVVSRRDEIIPPEDVDRIAEHVGRTRFLTHDDAHGSPEHVTESRLWSILCLQRMRGTHRLQRALLRAALCGLRLKNGPRPS